MINAVYVDWKTTSIDQRERCAVAEDDIPAFLKAISGLEGIKGCVLLQTCNRFEFYVHVEKSNWQVLAKGILKICGFTEDDQAPDLFQCSDKDAQYRLLEIACGLQSQILGEEQILTQVRSAIETARSAQVTTPELETLFRLAVTAGKATRTQIQLQTISSSSAHKAVKLAQESLGGLKNKRVVVIGNGKMGRLASELLIKEGADVTITLRSYKHGQTTVPSGAKTVPYNERQQAVEGIDLLISATRSPHYTFTKDMLKDLQQLPSVIIDVALPRDIEPSVGEIENMVLFDMDDLQDGELSAVDPQVIQVRGIIDKYLSDFDKWCEGRERYRKRTEKRIALFAGTVEGRLIAEHFVQENRPLTVFTATEYGGELLPESDCLIVHTGRLNAEQIATRLKDFDVVVDATHPYAKEVTDNIKSAAGVSKTEYLRVIRPVDSLGDDIVSVPDYTAAADFLKNTAGNVLLTTGSQALDEFTAIPNFKERLYPRFLPDAESISRCIAMGYDKSHLICMQGPFDHDLNYALLKSIDAQWMVTKNAGNIGGFPDKLSAAAKADVKVIVIDRPDEKETGFDYHEICRRLTGNAPVQFDERMERFPLFIDLVGKNCLVIGGGVVGMRRSRVFRNFGANVTQVSKSFSEKPQDIRILEREFRPDDVAGMDLVVAATGDRDVNHSIYQVCTERNIPVSVADNPEECTFFFPAICQSKHLTAGVVSQGDRHPLVAKAAAALRKTMEEVDR